MLRSLIILVILFYSIGQTFGQVGITGFYNVHSGAEDWEAIMFNGSEEKVLDNSVGVAVDYWFRLKNIRIEFLPEIGYSQGNKDGLTGELMDLEWNRIHFMANTNIYAFDMEGDCNCPTFGKDGSFFQKGFYFQLSPGISHWSASFDRNAESENVASTNFLIGLGLGLDIGVTKLLTVTPMVRYLMTFGATWERLDQRVENGELMEKDVTSSVADIMLGLRVGYRFDYRGR